MIEAVSFTFPLEFRVDHAFLYSIVKLNSEKVELVNYSLIVNQTTKEIHIDHPFLYGIIKSKREEEFYVLLFAGYVSKLN
ncbi:hypothetical protein ALC53_01161 [Atta colombica]|uniref:Serpin domain-containing protein n=1 Tax=Atta colombica TaxID=520822 RepID=A0A195BVU6_9HYME|nr:hypothetical protein ALC53_01161 [Atta colombica]